MKSEMQVITGALCWLLHSPCLARLFERVSDGPQRTSLEIPSKFSTDPMQGDRIAWQQELERVQSLPPAGHEQQRYT